MDNIFENYKSPITVNSDFEEQIMQEQENQIMCKIRTVVDVDKQELIKALNYDRKQYEAGYKAGVCKMRKSAYWSRIDYYPVGHDYICSVCNYKSAGNYNYCPECGAIMMLIN